MMTLFFCCSYVQGYEHIFTWYYLMLVYKTSIVLDNLCVNVLQQLCCFLLTRYSLTLTLLVPHEARSHAQMQAHHLGEGTTCGCSRSVGEL